MGRRSGKKTVPMIYLSTGGDRTKSGFECVQELLQYGINAFELSGGRYDPEQLAKLKTLLPVASLQVHNYFPPPAQPFVMNLASSDEKIAEQSMSQVRKAIEWSAALGKKTYSVHAGFLFDPKPSGLGKGISKTDLENKDKAFELFINRVKILAGEYAAEGGTLLIENNVLSKQNLSNFGDNPFLLSDAADCKAFMNEMPENVSLLIDVAHLKVSAHSLGFDPVFMINECSPWTYAYHLSDNDGIADSNGVLTEDAWFWQHLRKDVNFYVLEVYHLLPETLLQQIDLISDMIKKYAI